jgi:hypothetical protein
MNEHEKILCVGGPLAGDMVEVDPVPDRYNRYSVYGHIMFVYDGSYTDYGDIMASLMYGYEQHCKAVAERNKPFDKNEERADKLLDTLQEHQDIIQCKLKVADERVKAIQDHYTASFLRSCRTVIVGNPFGESNPLTFTYGKNHLGEINDSLEFIARGEVHNANYGRITLICILP